jgi:FkbM family methyltransferase
MIKSFRSPAKIVRRLRLTPLAARKLASWPRFICNYALGLVPDVPYEFRNRARIKIGRGVDHVPIIEIFLREDYGAVADGAVILDLGANIGVFSVYAATTARDVTIYAYEPMTNFYRLMQENVLINRLDGAVRCFNAAVAGSAHTRELFVEGTDLFFPTLISQGHHKATRKVSVTCTTLADILDSNGLQRVDLLKMDCEGAEYEILYHTPAHYFDRIREIRMEYHNLADERHNSKALAAFLHRVGYDDIILPQSASATRTTGNLWARKHD